MAGANDIKTDPRLAGLDATGTIDLCLSLADYGEAGGLSRELMLQVGRYAENRYGDSADVLLAAARMYLQGGEPARALEALFRANRLGPEETRVRPLLDAALKKLGDPRSSAEALRDAPPPDADKASALAERSANVSQAGLPAVKEGAVVRGFPGAFAARRPGPRSAEPSSAPGSARSPERTKTAPTRQRIAPGTIQARGGPSAGQSAAASAARAPLESAPSAEIRTEISRRQAREPLGSTPPDSADRPADRPPAWAPGAPRTKRIRLLDPEDDRRLDPYELIGEIASGGMATVYLGRLAGAGGFQRLVAIKRLHPHLAREQQFVDMFLDEARLAARIHHPHVVPILEVGQSPAGYYLVMEFVEGDTLSGLTVRSLQRGAILPPPAALRIVLDTLSGLHAAHQLMGDDNRPLGLVHRDCTPQNILVGVDGSARITDFGVARAASRITITATHQVKGKVGYLSPEQSQAMEIDRRSDIFTMGIVLWEALAGRPLFQGDTEAVTLSRMLSAPIPSVRSFVPDIPPALDEVCQQALQRDRSRRFRTAAEMGEAIERAARAEGFVGVASTRDLGRFVEGVLGPELIAQREAIRTWSSENEPAPRSRAPYSPATPPRIVTPLPPSGRTPAQTTRERASSADLETPTPSLDPSASRPTVRPTSRPDIDVPRKEAPSNAALEKADASPAPAPAVEKTAPSEAAPAEIVAREAAKEAPAAPPAKPSSPPPSASTVGPQAAPHPGLLRSPVARLTKVKLSTRTGLILVAVLVLLATAPVWIRRLRQMRAGSAGRPAASAHGPAPKASSNGWSDKDWGGNGPGAE